MSDMHTVCLFRKIYNYTMYSNYLAAVYTFLLVDEGEGLLLHLLVGEFVKHCRVLPLSHLHDLVETHCEQILTS